MGRIRSDSNSVKASSFAETYKLFIHRCQNAVSSIFIDPRWAVAATLLIVQTGLIGLLIAYRSAPIYPDYAEWRSVGGGSQYQGPVLQITFKSSATEEEIRLLLVKIRGSFLGGPGQLGNYIVKVPEDSIEGAQKHVMDSPIVESVQVLQELPVDR